MNSVTYMEERYEMKARDPQPFILPIQMTGGKWSMAA